MSKYDNIEDVQKADETGIIDEVRKFNPFHDNLGKFSNKNGFASYSANPKTKAGAMAIQRSAAAGHGRTMNVHAQSKGESIAQNDRWLKTGIKPKTPAAVSRARYQQRKQKLQQQAQQGQQNQQAQQKPTQQAQQKPTQQQAQQPQQPQGGSLAANVAGVKVTPSEKLALQARDGRKQPTTTRKVADDHYQDRVAGKDISKTVNVAKISDGEDPIDKIARAQGWNQSPTVTNDRDVFNAACIQSGRVMIRTVHADRPSGLSNDQVAKITMTDGNTPLGGSGGKAYGSGMYMTDTKISNFKTNLKNAIASAQDESFGYGDRQMMATVHPSAKIATPTQAAQMQSEYRRLSRADKARFGYDPNSYIASKGYDGAKWHNDNDPTAYTTVYNKSALIFFGGVANDF